MSRIAAPRPLALLLAAVLAGLAGRAEAALNCGTRLITEGDTSGELLARCGEPASVDRKVVYRAPVVWREGRAIRVPGGDIEVQVEYWTYNFGRNKLMRRVTLEDGRVRAIETLGYGYP
jgi:hypothetical protein